jgi:predicted transcriptional regulator
MARRNVIIEEKTEHYTRYYCSPLEPEEKKLLSILRQRRLREIVVIILLSKKAKYQFIVETTNVPASTVSFYLRCLMESNIIERTKIGYENVYTLKDEDKIAKVLIAYQTSFFDQLVDRWISTWFEPNIQKNKLSEEPV